jgi:hypothetical protein
MDARTLPRVDRQILLFERWYRDRLTQIDDTEHVRLLRQFVTWRLLPKLHDQATRGPLSNGSRNTAAGRFNIAVVFLTWLGGRQLRQTTQADIDLWQDERPDPRRLDAFLEWAMAAAHMPRLQLPADARTDRAPISQDRRLVLLRHFLTEEEILLRTRVAACLVLLYAQAVSRLVRLTVEDVLDHDGQVSLRLGAPPTPVPEPFAAMLTELAANRANMSTATNPDCDWLFPGGRAGQSLSPGALLQQLRAHGVPVTQTRTAAFRHLVLQAPAPVVAQALGYHHGTATKHRTAAGGTWNRYPAQR